MMTVAPEYLATIKKFRKSAIHKQLSKAGWSESAVTEFHVYELVRGNSLYWLSAQECTSGGEFDFAQVYVTVQPTDGDTSDCRS